MVILCLCVETIAETCLECYDEISIKGFRMTDEGIRMTKSEGLRMTLRKRLMERDSRKNVKTINKRRMR